MTADRLIAGRYRLSDPIGAGAMGVVWRATDVRLRRTVAVKQLILAPGLSKTSALEAKLRAMREGRIAARLHHPHAITVFDVAEEDGQPWLVMEYMDAPSLAAKLSGKRTLAPIEVAKIGAQAAAALAAAHDAGIMHRDVKPANLLVGDDGTVKITDFGISRAVGDVTVTATGFLAGTPAYLAPEVARGEDPEPASDVFALGSTLYAAVHGTPPFGEGDNPLAVLHAVARGTIELPEGAGTLGPVLMRLLSPTITARPTMREAQQELEAVVQGRAPEPVPTARTKVMPAPEVGSATTVLPEPGTTDSTEVVPSAAVGDSGAAESISVRPPSGSAPTSVGADRARRNRVVALTAGAAVVLFVVVGLVVVVVDSSRTDGTATQSSGSTSTAGLAPSANTSGLPGRSRVRRAARPSRPRPRRPARRHRRRALRPSRRPRLRQARRLRSGLPRSCRVTTARCPVTCRAAGPNSRRRTRRRPVDSIHTRVFGARSDR